MCLHRLRAAIPALVLMAGAGIAAAAMAQAPQLGAPPPGQAPQQPMPEQQARIDALTRTPLAQRGPRWRCDIISRAICLNGGCERGDGPKSWLLLDLKAKKYSRCADSGCDTFDAQDVAGGVFTSVYVQNRPVFFRTLNDGSTFMEVTGLGLSSVTSFGMCSPS